MNMYFAAWCDCLHLTRLLRRSKKIDQLDVWEPSDCPDVKSICEKVFYEGYTITDNLKPALWKNMLGVYYPTMEQWEDRHEYMTKLHQVYGKLKKKWQDQWDSDQSIRRLFEAVKRDADRTDVNESFYSDPANQRTLVDVIVTYVLEHPNVSYTQGMTDILSPILFVMKNEADAYICFSCVVQPIQDNFNPHCEGVLSKIEVLKHLCEVLIPDLYRYLTGLDQDAFTLCFGMILIECRREFPFQASIDLLETIVASRYGLRMMTDNMTDVLWANFMTTASMDVLEDIIASEDKVNSITSINGEDVNQSPVISSAQLSYSHQPTEAAGYHISRSQSATSHVTSNRKSLEQSTAESRGSIHNQAVSNLSTPVPLESGLDSSVEGDALTDYPLHKHNFSSPEADRVTPVRFYDNPSETALEISSGHSSRASSVPPSRLDASSGFHQVYCPTQSKFEVVFPIFICLATLLHHRSGILNQQIDFIGISGLLNDHLDNLDLSAILQTALKLKQHYHYLQEERFGHKTESFSRWLVEEIKKTQ